MFVDRFYSAILVTCGRTLHQRLSALTSPTTEWGPALVKYRKLVHYVPGFVIDPWGTGTKKEPVDYDNMAVGITLMSDLRRI